MQKLNLKGEGMIVKMIYTITKVQDIILNKSNKSNCIGDIFIGDIHRIGYFEDLTKARQCVSNLDKDIHKYVIIESIEEGIYQTCKYREIYKWEKGNYVNINEPTLFKKLTNFSLG
jgi:hypothetical protein